MPTTLPILSITGTALMRFLSRMFAASRTVACCPNCNDGGNHHVARLHDWNSLRSLSILGFSLEFRIDPYQAADTQCVRKLRHSVQRNDRKDPSENLPSGPDQRRANDQERAVPRKRWWFFAGLAVWRSSPLLRRLRRSRTARRPWIASLTSISVSNQAWRHL